MKVFADFRDLTPLEKVQRFIKDNKDTWLEGFQSIDEGLVYRVPIPDFFDISQVSFGNITLFDDEILSPVEFKARYLEVRYTFELYILRSSKKLENTIPNKFI